MDFLIGAQKAYRLGRSLYYDGRNLHRALGGGVTEDVAARATGIFTQSQYKTYQHTIPRNVWQDIVGEPRFSTLANGKGGATNITNRMGIQTFEFLNAYELSQFMRQMRLFYNGDNTTFPPGNTISIDESKYLGAIFTVEQELILTNWSNGPARMWIVEYSYKKNGKKFRRNVDAALEDITFEALWRAGYNLDTAQTDGLGDPTVYGYSYGRSDPLKAYINVHSSKEVHMAPGQTHIHKSLYKLNKFVDMQQVITRPDWDDASTANYRLAGYTRGIAIIWHGMLGTTVESTDPALLPVELAWAWRRSMNGVLQDRIYGKTQVNNQLTAALQPDNVVVPQTGLITSFKDLVA